MENVLDDERLQAIEQEREKAQTDATTAYDNMINDSQKYYDQQTEAIKKYEDTQKDLQQQQTNITLEKIEQQKAEANKEYEKTQKSSYIDYQKANSQFGELAEQMASQGLSNSGVSENARTQMYVAYQNQVASAKENLNKAILNYNNSAKEAQLANNVALAEIANNALQQQLQISLQAFQYKNSLLESKQAQLNTINSRYDTKYSELLSQLQREQELEESRRQWREEFNQRVKENDERIRQWREEFNLSKQESDRQYQLAVRNADRNYQLALQELEDSRAYRLNDSSNKVTTTRDDVINNIVNEINNNSDYRKLSDKQIASAIHYMGQKLNITEEEEEKVLSRLEKKSSGSGGR